MNVLDITDGSTFVCYDLMVCRIAIEQYKMTSMMLSNLAPLKSCDIENRHDKITLLCVKRIKHSHEEPSEHCIAIQAQAVAMTRLNSDHYILVLAMSYSFIYIITFQ